MPEQKIETTATVEADIPAPQNPTTATVDDPEATDKTTTEAVGTVGVTTEERKPLEVPESVHIRITSGNLKDYVGPPIYHKDRLYAKPPPPGVSSGLGYLGNGSGAVMPIEATVRTQFRLLLLWF